MAFADETDAEIAERLVRHAFEANLLIRIASLRGIPVHVDLVERTDPAHPNGYTEIRVRAGERQWP